MASLRGRPSRKSVVKALVLGFRSDALTEAVSLADSLFAELDIERYYLLSREMNARLYQVMRMNLPEWIESAKKAKVRYARAALADRERRNGVGGSAVVEVVNREPVKPPTEQVWKAIDNPPIKLGEYRSGQQTLSSEPHPRSFDAPLTD